MLFGSIDFIITARQRFCLIKAFQLGLVIRKIHVQNCKEHEKSYKQKCLSILCKFSSISIRFYKLYNNAVVIYTKMENSLSSHEDGNYSLILCLSIMMETVTAVQIDFLPREKFDR